MANRNATRHLLLVASVLLCFFVYMGYRLAGPAAESAAPAASTAPGMDIAGLTASGSAFPGGPAGMSSGGEGALRPPAAPAGFTSTDAARPPAGLTPPAADDGPMLLSPIGSAEEADTALTPPAAASGAIVGLVPAPSMKRPPAAPNAAAPADNAPALIPPAAAPSAVAPPASVLPPGLLTPPSGGAEITNRGSAPGLPPAATSAPAGGRPGPGAPLAPPAMSEAAPPLPPAAPAMAETPPPLPPARRERPAVAPGPDAVPPAGVLAAGDETPSDSLRMYVVRPGDTLSRIATRELGSISLADNIFLLNRDVIPDPDQLMAGVKIRLPVRSTGGADAGFQSAYTEEHGDWPADAPAAASGGMAAEQVRVHTVAPGDTLSSISMRYYGSSSGWRFLHEVNAKTIANPNRLTVGTELVVPPYGEEQ